jgi:hypothetical protein
MQPYTQGGVGKGYNKQVSIGINGGKIASTDLSRVFPIITTNKENQSGSNLP